MINCDDVLKENKKENNSNWLRISYHTYRILIVGSFRSGKKLALLNLINHHPIVDRIFLYVRINTG